MESVEKNEIQSRYGFGDSLMDKIEHGVDLLRKAETLALRVNPDGFYLAFSGGKDSQALYHLVLLAKVKFKAHMNMTTMDPKEVISFVKSNYPEVERHIPELNFYQLIEKRKFLPSRLKRYCCQYLKEGGGGGTVSLIGIRKEESINRSKRPEISSSKRKVFQFDQFSEHEEEMVSCVNGKDRILISPILEWTEKDVWEFLDKQGIKHCELYDQGAKRIGCIFCPMSNISELLNDLYRYPHKTKKLRDSIERICQHQEGVDPYRLFLSYVLKIGLSKLDDFLIKVYSGKFRPRNNNKEIYDKFIKDYIIGKVYPLRDFTVQLNLPINGQ